MSLEEFHQQPFSLVFKQEYINGRLVESSRDVIIHGAIPVAPRAIPSPLLLRPTTPDDERALLPCFRAAFAEAFEFCDYSREQFARGARESLHHFYNAEFHRPLPASGIALGPSGTREAGKPIGAALVLQQNEGWALLDMIFVSPRWQRRGLANALAAAAMTELHTMGGCRTLISRYHLGNEASCVWHHRFGFVDEPDLRLAQLYLRAARHELRRREQMRMLTSAEKQRLTVKRDKWQHEVDRLEALVRCGREEDAIPWRKWCGKSRDEESQQ